MTKEARWVKRSSACLRRIERSLARALINNEITMATMKSHVEGSCRGTLKKLRNGGKVVIEDCSYSSLFRLRKNPWWYALVFKGKKAIANGWLLERIFREWTRGKVCSTTNAVDRLLFRRYQVFAVFARKQALGKNVDTISWIYSFQVLIIIELALILLREGEV